MDVDTSHNEATGTSSAILTSRHFASTDIDKGSEYHPLDSLNAAKRSANNSM
jgi:hypothetical protein